MTAQMSVRGRHSCTVPGCHSTYTNKRTLQRHVRVDHGSESYKCDGCGQTFRRRDNRDRHQAEKHDRSISDVVCLPCNKRLLPRCIDGHLGSESHRRAESSIDTEELRLLRLRRKLPLVLQPDVEDFIDPLVITAWLFYNTNPVNNGLHIARCPPRPTGPYAEIFRLQCLATRVLYKNLENCFASKPLDMIRAIEHLTMVDTMLDLRLNCNAHYRHLASLRAKYPQSIINEEKPEEDDCLSLLKILGSLATEKPIIPASSSFPSPVEQEPCARYPAGTELDHVDDTSPDELQATMSLSPLSSPEMVGRASDAHVSNMEASVYLEASSPYDSDLEPAEGVLVADNASYEALQYDWTVDAHAQNRRRTSLHGVAIKENLATYSGKRSPWVQTVPDFGSQRRFICRLTRYKSRLSSNSTAMKMVARRACPFTWLYRRTRAEAEAFVGRVMI